MQPEQQQRIMGYFIEEAKDHLNTIEQGLLNLQSTIEDQEMVNELFRAAHSVKGGAAMLGLNSIQQVSHRLEDYFKILKESPVKVDQKLESLFLQVFDALQELVGQLQGPFGLTDETANATVSGVEPVFAELENHLNVLASGAAPASSLVDRPATTTTAAQQDSVFISLFQTDIPLRLREMLQLFKQSELDAANRQQLQDLCRQLIGMGEQFNLPNWCQLLEQAHAAIGYPENAYRTLAPIVIRDIKRAQEQVLSGRAADIAPCPQLQALQPPAPSIAVPDDDFADLLASDLNVSTDDSDWLTTPHATTDEDALFAGLETAEPASDFSNSLDFSDSLEAAMVDAEADDQQGPEVGMAELNSLADLFEGEMPDLGSTWQEEEILTETTLHAANSVDTDSLDESTDFSDLLFDETEMGQEEASTSSQDALTDLFSDDALTSDALISESPTSEDDRARVQNSTQSDELDALFGNSGTADLTAATATGTEAFDEAAFDDMFGESGSDTPPDAASTTTAFGLTSTADSPLNNLGELFDGMDGEQDLAFSSLPGGSESTPVELELDELELDNLDASLLDDAPGKGPAEHSAMPLMAPDISATPIADPWEELNQHSVAEPPVSAAQPTSPWMDEAVVPTPESQSDFGTGDFFEDQSSPDAIEELSDQGDLDDLDFSSLLNATADQTPTDAFSDAEPLVEELADDSGFDPSIASLLADDSTPGDDADLPGFDQLVAEDSFSELSATTIQSDSDDPWGTSQPPQTQLADLEAPIETLDAAGLDLDFNDIDFGNSEDTGESTAALDENLDIDFAGLDADNALDASLLDTPEDWLVLHPSEPAIDPVAALEEPLINETAIDDAGTLPNADPLSESLEPPPDFDTFDFDAASASLDALSGDALSGAESSNMTDALGDFFDQPAQSDDSLELPDDLLAIGVESDIRSGDMPLEALSDDRLGLSDLDSMDESVNGLDEPSIAAVGDNLDLGEMLSADILAAEALSDTPSEAWDLSFDTETDAPPVPTETNAEEESLDFDTDRLDFGDLANDAPPSMSSAENSLDFCDALETENSLDLSDTPETSSLDFGDDFFALQTSESSDLQTLENLDASDAPPAEASTSFDESLLDFDEPNERNGTTTEGADSDAFSLEFDRSAFDALGFDSTSEDPAMASTDLLFEDVGGDDASFLFDQATTDAPAEVEPFESHSLLETDAAASAMADFDWETATGESGADEQASGEPLLDFDQLLDESSTPSAIDAPGEFDDFLNEGNASETTDDLAFNDLLGEETDEFADLNSLLEDNATDSGEFSGLDALLDQETPSADALSDLDNLLSDTPDSDATPSSTSTFEAVAGGMMAFGAATAASSPLNDFSDLESLLQGDSFESNDAATSSDGTSRASEFDELDDLLKDAEEKMGGSPTVKLSRSSVSAQNRRPTRPGRVFSEQTMRVPVKHLDNLSNLVGELVVNRNSLEEDQERLRQSLDNLLYQVQQLSDVGQRMQDLYERSLLESSLLASRQSHRSAFSLPSASRDSGTVVQAANGTGIEYDPLEMDRFTGFHSLSQEMIELIVRVRESASDIEFIVDETDQVTRMFRQVTTQLQEGLTRSRMVPFAQTADRLPRAVRDIAMKVGKQAELNVEGRETLIDKMILEQLYDPMTHLVNNAITHGIESPEVRRAAGKPPAGRITIRAFHQGNQTIISVSDDGAGIDIDRVKAKAIEKGLISATEAQSMSRLDMYDLLFHAGFSTKDQADDFSGRGVGMDVVRTSLSEIRGAINTDSTYGKGTTFTIRLPLTLSISKALCCISDRARIAFPMDGVEDMLDVPKERIQTNAEGQACIPWRDSLLPLRPLNDLLSYSRHLSRGNVYGGNQEDDIVSIVVLRSAGNFLALQVDQVLGEQEIVIKQLEGPIPKPVGVAGATVLGDGRIMPIADVLELIDLSMGRIRRDVGGSLWEQGGISMVQEAPVAKTEPTVLIVDDSITVRELLSMTFNKVGYRVEQARDGQEAWEKLRAGLPCDIVFCDIEMPRMDGLELLSRIQKDPNLSHLPIAMLTSRGADRHRQMAVSLGASGYFTKPYLEEALLDAAQRMLKGEVLISSSNA
ncbi:MAG: response regulator [Lyngbya sp. HA4199-MV5]|jgi:chemosensory pili system protein ChpA (sensor histidine kinase/response regulator)|nr:response regulator [Lyngbya sp. HA4199-MV5]